LYEGIFIAASVCGAKKQARGLALFRMGRARPAAAMHGSRAFVTDEKRQSCVIAAVA
jgi:hypothetical protein